MVRQYFIIYPNKDMKVILQEYNKIKHRLDIQFDGVIIIKDNISKEDEDEYVKFVNENITYNGLIGTSTEVYLLERIEEIGGCNDDEIYTFKNNNITLTKFNY